MRKALVVFSGGQDSTTCLYWAKREYDEVEAITFDYGQRHSREIDAATTICEKAKVKQTIVTIPDVLQSTSPLTDPTAELEQYTSHDEMEEIIGDRIEKTFVPMRNAFFLTIAANYAVANDCQIIVTGVCEADNANYPDCRLSFILAQQATINEALGVDYMTIVTPLMKLNKELSIRLAETLPGCMKALAYSHTAYDGSYPPSGADHATVLRAQGFLNAGVPDPLIVRAWKEGLTELPSTPNYNRIGNTSA